MQGRFEKLGAENRGEDQVEGYGRRRDDHCQIGGGFGGTLQSVCQGHHEGRRRHEEGDVAQPDPLTAPVNRVILSRCQKNRREPI